MSTENFILHFNTKWSSHLGIRVNTFRKALKYLLDLKLPEYCIVETGSCRKLIGGDGQATILFDEFVNMCGGQVHTVDIDPIVAAFASQHTSSKTTTHCADSVITLWNSEIPAPDLLYLDSFDLSAGKCQQSAMHHLHELLAISSKLKPHTLILVDDHVFTRESMCKGTFIERFFEQVGNAPFIAEGAQIGWIWNR